MPGSTAALMFLGDRELVHSMRIERRSFLTRLLGTPVLATLGGCDEDRTSKGRLRAVWGRAGVSDGRFNKPRAMAIDADDLIYIVDITARIQVFTTAGEFVRGWQTPVHVNGRPTGLGFDRRGNLLVADTHYFRLLTYSRQGELLETLGGIFGHAPGEFGFVTDAVEDSQGNLYVSEYGEYDRIQKGRKAGSLLARSAWPSTAKIIFGFLTPAIIESRSSTPTAASSDCGARMGANQANSHTLMGWRSMAKATCT